MISSSRPTGRNGNHCIQLMCTPILPTNSMPSTFGAAPVTNIEELMLVPTTIIHIR